jgi:F0F1-type ATP synthase assembly protein I
LNRPHSHARKLVPVGKIGDVPDLQQGNQTSFLRRVGLYIGIAFELPGTILGGLLVGYLLDQYFVTAPWFLIMVGAIAFVGSFVRMLKWVKYFARERNASRSEKNRAPH